MAEWANVDDIESYEDAVQVVLEGINMRVDPMKVLWCNYPSLGLEHNELSDKVRKDTRKLEKEVEDDLCLSRLWYVGIPRFRLIKRGIPHLSCEIDLYYVACDVTNENYHPCWFGMVIPKADNFDIPLCLISPIINALKNNETETTQANVVERTSGYSVYDLLGQEWKVPDAFMGFVWALAEKGKGFEGLLDPVSCSLIDKFAKELPSPEAPKLVSGGDYLLIISAITNLGYSKSEAEKVAKYVMEKFQNETLENKIKEALKYLGT